MREVPGIGAPRSRYLTQTALSDFIVQTLLSELNWKPTMHSRHSHTQHSGPGRRPTKTASTGMALLLVLALAQLMVILDISAVNVALPDLGRDLEIAGSDLGWTITSYSLVFGSLLLLGGRAADLLGRRRVFLAGLGIFIVGSLASALASSA